MKLLTGAVLIPVPKFKLATEDGDVEVNFKILFKRQSSTERKRRNKDLRGNLKLMKKLSKVADDKDADDATIDDIQAQVDKSDAKYDKMLADDIVGWRDLVEEDGTEIKFTAANKAELLDSDPFREAILSVWNLSSGGVKPDVLAEAEAKN